MWRKPHSTSTANPEEIANEYRIIWRYYRLLFRLPHTVFCIPGGKKDREPGVENLKITLWLFMFLRYRSQPTRIKQPMQPTLFFESSTASNAIKRSQLLLEMVKKTLRIRLGIRTITSALHLQVLRKHPKDIVIGFWAPIQIMSRANYKSVTHYTETISS